jgi:teichuronopeptide biosynthesis TupA-like protein
MDAVSRALFKVSGVLPKTRTFDYGLALARFLQAHRRFPRMSGGGLNDALFYVKTSDEMLDPLRAFVSDKARVKQYVSAKVGDAHNVPTIAVLQSYEEARDFPYPADCVIKPTHMSGEIILRRGGSAIDLEKVRSWFDRDFYSVSREVNYRNLRRRVIVEPYIFGQESVQDYKVLCLHGEPVVMQVSFDRHTHHTLNLYTMDWERLPFAMGSPIGPGKSKPANLGEMISIAARLSDEFNLVRIDLYTDGQTVLVGEITNCHGGANLRFVPAESEAIMSRMFFGEAGFSPSTLRRLKPRTLGKAGRFVSALASYGGSAAERLDVSQPASKSGP